MKKQLLALAGALTLGFGAAGWSPAVGEEATPHALVGWAVADRLAGAGQNAISAMGAAAAGSIGKRAAQAAANVPAMKESVQVAARVAFRRQGMLMGARVGAMFGVWGGLPGLVIGTGIGAL